MIKVDTARAAEILVESIYRSDKAVAKEWGISTKTIQNYRKRMSDDESLTLAFREKRQSIESQWADQLGGVILETMEFLRRAAREADPTDPEVIHAVTGSLKIIAQIEITRTAINARYAISNGSADSHANQIRTATDPVNKRIIEGSRSD